MSDDNQFGRNGQVTSRKVDDSLVTDQRAKPITKANQATERLIPVLNGWKPAAAAAGFWFTLGTAQSILGPIFVVPAAAFAYMTLKQNRWTDDTNRNLRSFAIAILVLGIFAGNTWLDNVLQANHWPLIGLIVSMISGVSIFSFFTAIAATFFLYRYAKGEKEEKPEK